MNTSRPRQDPLFSPQADVAGLMRHLDACVSPSHAVDYCGTQLRLAGFQEVSFSNLGRALPNCGFIAESGLLLAWDNSSKNFSHFRIVGAHTDSPCLKVEPLPDAGNFGWRQLGVEIYGGILSNSWLDRDLGVAGRVVLSDHSVALVRVDEAVARIPQLAIHLDRDVNERGLILDKQIHLMPIWGLGDSTEGHFKEWLSSKIGVGSSQIVSWDLGLYDLTPASLLGSDSSLIASGRLDNQVSCWAAIEGLIAAKTRGDNSTNCSVVALFDHEEVGSQSTHGAAGPRLQWLLESLSAANKKSFHEVLAASHCISADNAHAVHPNYPERHDAQHRPLPNLGPVLKSNANQRFATSPESAAVFIEACTAANVPYQYFVSKNTMPCGSTIGPITSTQLGIPTVDVGVAQLSMHSARELCGALDPLLFTQTLAHYFVAE